MPTQNRQSRNMSSRSGRYPDERFNYNDHPGHQNRYNDRFDNDSRFDDYDDYAHNSTQQFAHDYQEEDYPGYEYDRNRYTPDADISDYENYDSYDNYEEEIGNKGQYENRSYGRGNDERPRYGYREEQYRGNWRPGPDFDNANDYGNNDNDRYSSSRNSGAMQNNRQYGRSSGQNYDRYGAREGTYNERNHNGHNYNRQDRMYWHENDRPYTRTSENSFANGQRGQEQGNGRRHRRGFAGTANRQHNRYQQSDNYNRPGSYPDDLGEY